MGNGTEKVFYRRGRNFYADGKLKPLAAKMRKSRKRRAEFLNRQLRQTRERGSFTEGNEVNEGVFISVCFFNLFEFYFCLHLYRWTNLVRCPWFEKKN